MSRLIDADKLLEAMRGMNMLFSPKIVIDNQSIAFDKEKVIEELENLDKAYHANDFAEYEQILFFAIEIVERGGVDAN